MNATGVLFRLLLGSRLARTEGTVAVPGMRAPVAIRRDAHGIPCIEAEHDEDAWFGLGFCQGQDRGFQIEALVRAARGTLAEIAGRDGLPVDRLSRRLGFRRAAAAQMDVVADDVRSTLGSFARGVNAGRTAGVRRRPHELALLRARPTPLEAVDVIAVSKLVGFALSTNWDVELARLRVLSLDGPEALRDVNPAYPEWHAVTDPPGAAAGPALDRLAGDLLAFKTRVGSAGGSNNWALAPERTASGRPIVANDPHLEPVLPNHWYLAHVRTPRWAIAGAALAGTPAVVAGHNERVAWGVTAGMVDDTDLFLEEVGPDGASLRQGDGFVPCERRVERIRVRGGAVVDEDVLVGPRGPIVGSAIDTSPWVVSLLATWMTPRPLGGFLRAHGARTCDELRTLMAEWPGPSLNLVCADADGAIAWQLIGDAPQRRRGFGTVPLAGWAPRAGWAADPVPPEEMPAASDPPEGFLASANNNPRRDGAGPYLGSDWVDGYRVTRIAQALDARWDWSVESCAELQRDVVSLPWEEMRPFVLRAAGGDGEAGRARALLESWDGRVAWGSPAAAVFEMFVADMARRAVSA
ncbi:MAG TPA: penicillin acylase family protein, partial [Actinomycetota bacterium]|nr:penicillin acylase family protein [Actinomycetota bacterium]